MLMFLRSLHPLAAQRGEGLRPELVPKIAQASSRTSVEQPTGVPSEGKEPAASADASPPLAIAVSPLRHKR
jgi:hypothetical protein